MTILPSVGGFPTRDSEVVLVENIEINPSLYFTMCALSVMGLAYTTGSVTFNLYFRNTK